MIISKSELLDLFEDAYSASKQAELISKESREKLADYAEDHELSKKSVKAAYSSYKAFKDGRADAKDEDFFSMLAIIEEHFGGEDTNSADEVSV